MRKTAKSGNREVTARNIEIAATTLQDIIATVIVIVVIRPDPEKEKPDIAATITGEVVSRTDIGISGHGIIPSMMMILTILISGGMGMQLG